MVFEDKSNSLELAAVTDREFILYANGNVLNLGLSTSTFWLKFFIKNKTKKNNLLLALDQANLNLAQLYFRSPEGNIDSVEMGDHKNFYDRIYHHPVYVFELSIPLDSVAVYYLKVKSDEPVILPLILDSNSGMIFFLSEKKFIMGFFLGFILVMILYNLFLYSTLKLTEYKYYILYLIFIILAQASIHGYTFQYFWPDSEFIKRNSFFVFAPLTTVFAMFFLSSFLKLKDNFYFFHKTLNYLSVLFVFCIILSLSGRYFIAFYAINILTLLACLIGFICGFLMYRRGFRSAQIFLYGWSFLITGVIVYVLKEMSLLPHVFLTEYSIQIGSAIEVILLSVALSDRINFYKEEKISEIKEKEIILLNQKDILVRKVNERTKELKEKLIQIEMSNKEKDVLLKEIHDRVKNNLQVIASLLGLQKLTINDEKVLNIINNSQNRINSMALIHEMLYQKEGFFLLNYNDYLVSLVDMLLKVYRVDKETVEVGFEIPKIYLNIDTAIPLGLIINEIVSNSLKHAFDSSVKGFIDIKIINNDFNSYILEISDDGKGYDDSTMNYLTSPTLGLKLIYQLTKQLNGTIDKVKNTNGTKYKMIFSVDK